MSSKSAFTRRRAFTLIEVLVAAGITVLIAGWVVLILSNVLFSWSRISGKVEAERQARLVLDQLALDLQSALFRDDGAVWLAATILDQPGNSGLWEMAARQKPAGRAGHSLDPAAAGFAEARFGQAGVWLRFFTDTRGSNDLANFPTTASAPAAIAYQLIRHRAADNPASTDFRYLLYRSQVRPGESAARPGTLESGFDLDPALAESDYTRIVPGVNDGTQPDDPVSIRCPNNAGNVIGENVIDFGVRFYARDATGELTTVFPESEDQSENLERTRFPAAIDVLVRVLTEQGARQIVLLEAEPNRLGPRPVRYRNDAEWWWGIAEANSEVFVRRIVLPENSR